MNEAGEGKELAGKAAGGSRWWKWPVRLLAGFGALALVVIGVALAVAPRKRDPVQFSADEMIDQIMLNTYGKYSEAEKGWMYVNEHRQTYVMRVVHRAKMVDASGDEELYFVASGDYVETGSHEPVTGAFKVMPDPDKTDGSLIQISEAFMDGLGRGALRPEDIRFEALSHKTFGWVLKAADHWLGEDAVGSGVTSYVLAPNDQTVAVVAAFPALMKVEVGEGCAAAQARYADWRQAQSAPAASSPASASSSDEEEDEEEANDEDDGPPLRCTDASFTYKTSPVPDDGFVTFTVTGDGSVNGEHLSSKTWKLVFDHKSFSYLVPEALKSMYTGY